MYVLMKKIWFSRPSRF